MDFIDYCIYTKNFNAIEKVGDYVNLVRDDDKLTKKQKTRKTKLADKLSIAASLATLGYVGLRTGNYIKNKYDHLKSKENDDPSDDVSDPDDTLKDVQDEGDDSFDLFS